MATQRIEIGSSTIFRAILILLAFWFVFFVRDIVVLLFVGFIIASALEPVANWLQQRSIPRVLAVVLVYLALGVLLTALGTLLAEPLARQAFQLAQAVPEVLAQAEQLVPLLPDIDQTAVVDAVQRGLTTFGSDLANLGANVFAGTRTVFSGLFAVIFIIVFSFYLVLEQDAVKKLAKVVTPAAHHRYISDVVDRTRRAVGRWVLGLVVLGTIVGLLNGLGLWLLGVPYALLLGIVAGVLEALPLVGPIIAGVIGASVALSVSLTLALAAAGLYFIVGLIESYVLIPNIMHRAVGLRPIVTVIAVLLGARLGGVVGIFLAVPVATVLSVVLGDIFAKK